MRGEGQAGNAGGGSGAPGGAPDTSAAGGGSAGGGGDPEGVFDKSLGDFDGEIAREREAMASAGKGSGRAADSREAGDARAVKSGGSASVGGRGNGGSGASADEADGVPADTGMDSPAGAGSENAGAGQGEVRSGAQGNAGKGAEQQGAAAPDIPADIPPDGTGEDQVAKQLREAAMAEKDPAVRDALWEQYRRYTGIRK